MGACVNAPMIAVDDDYYEDLDYESTVKLIEALKRGERPTPGSVTGRRSSEAAGGATALTGAESE
jgi:NADH-quinone oxidoreductase subunit E